jgi:ABC-type lipoprotein export system ATPase subunit
MILITHDPDAAAIAGRIIRLRDGRIVEEVRHVH